VLWADRAFVPLSGSLMGTRKYVSGAINVAAFPALSADYLAHVAPAVSARRGPRRHHRHLPKSDIRRGASSAKTSVHTSDGVTCTDSIDEVGPLSGFQVQKGKSDFQKNERRKVNFFLYNNVREKP
jgi:hypothetical protein